MTSTRASLCLLFAFFAAPLAACGSSSTEDAGPDLGASDLGAGELGSDLGAPDLGPPDSGNVDAACSTDADGDGHVATACGGDDCDDADPTRYPGNTEVCDAAGHDEDCNPATFGTTDADGDGYVAATCCNTDGAATHCGDDCDDGNANIHPTQAEVCNAVDDDCDGLVDDIIHGTVVCRQGDSHACSTACGSAGTAPCSATCLGFDACAGPEVCNGCDDDNNGAVDDTFTCARAVVGTCMVPVCHTTGSRTCDGTCNWGSCTATEICNYCDDNGSGNFNEEKPFATAMSTDYFTGCTGGTLFGPATSCSTVPDVGSDFALWATLLDGTAVPQAGALWLEPASWVQGWGPMDVDVQVEATVVTAGGAYEMPLGGWSVVVARGGTAGVGPASANGRPASITGIGANWFWSDFDSTSSSPPSAYDATRAFAPGASLRPDSAAPTSDWGNFSGEILPGGAPGLDGPGSGTITQELHLTYTPDDPTTAPNEETLVVATTANGVGGSQTYRPSGAQPIGAGPLMIGITAGTYTRSGFSGPPSGATFGVPVRLRAHIFTQHFGSMGAVSFTYPQTITRAGLCP